MKRKVLLYLLVGLTVVCLLCIGAVAVRDALRSPADLWLAARHEIHVHNTLKGVRLMKRSADLGFPRAQYEMALMYDVGDKIPENRELALQYLDQALRAGLTEAYYVRAVWEERGYYGIPNLKRAVDYYEMAAAKGHLNAMKSLIVLYGDGVGGFPYNLKRRAYWMKKVENRLLKNKEIK